MGAESPNNRDDITRSISHVPPTHFIVKINSFSLLAENDVEKYESVDFEAGGYKWKLVVHPNGNKSKNVKDHISLYLSISNTSSYTFGWEVHAIIRLYLLNQINDEFLILQDAMGRVRRFHGLKLECGYDQFFPLEGFNDASNGYLVEDTCFFGAEVYVKESNICKGESLSMIKSPTSFKHVWKIENFSNLGANLQGSEVFSAGDHKWQITLYPKGSEDGKDSHVSIFLYLRDISSIAPGYKIYAKYTLWIRDQVKASHISVTSKKWFIGKNDNWGNAKFIEISKLIDPDSDYLKMDVCMVEAEVTVLGISKTM